MYHGLTSPISYKPEQQSKAAAEFNLERTRHNYAMLDKRLSDREHVCGAFTLVDTIVGATLRFGRAMGVKIDGMPHVDAYFERLSKRPALARVK
jgi:glutathione S-transferase